jgi:DUF4097 and DUF4098 domain-containing protein YvlB
MERIKSVLLSISLITLFTSVILSAQGLHTLVEKSFSVKEGQTLKLNTSSGDVYLSTWDKPEIYVKISGNNRARSKMKFRMEQNSDGVEINGKGQSWFNFLFWSSNIYVKYEIKLPAKYNTNIKTSGGDMKLYNLTGNIKMETSGGDVSIFNTSGYTRLSTSGGDIHMENNKGNFDVSTSGGNITAKDFYGDFHASTSGGDININGQDSKIEASTSGGNITLNYKGTNKGIELKTSGGNIDVRIPSGLKANLDLSTSGGEIECNLPTTRTTKMSSSKFKAETSGGGELIYCETSGGNIKVIE